MIQPLVLLRPQPGNDTSAERARALGLDVLQLPLFDIAAVPHAAPTAGAFGAILLTSSNGARHGGDCLAALPHLPLYAVGTASAAAARDAGHQDVHVGGGDAASTVPQIAAAGHRHVLHVAGADTRPFDPHGLLVTCCVVYRAEPLPAERVAARLSALGPAVIAVHSPRAGARLAELVPPAARTALTLAAISPAAAAACGAHWAEIVASPTPHDRALLALAKRLCMRRNELRSTKGSRI